MPWKRHRLRDADVWAEVDATGALITDDAGRVAVVYKREPNAKVYRASGRNLGAVADATIEADLGGGAAPAPAAKPAGATAAKPAAAGHAKPHGKAHGPAKLGDRLPADAIHVWTDGACTGNPGPAGLGVVVLDGRDRTLEVSEYLGHGTNNIAELTAVLRGLDAGRRSQPRRSDLHRLELLRSASCRKGWKAKANVRAGRRDQATPRCASSDVRFVKVPGHAGVAENERPTSSRARRSPAAARAR
jgi:ribonuclease HI